MNARIIDFHCDVLYKMLYHGTGRFEREADFDVTLPRLKQGRVGMQVFAVFWRTPHWPDRQSLRRCCEASICCGSASTRFLACVSFAGGTIWSAGSGSRT